ncbi:MAG: hypothetical protein ACREON_08395 [Gemmatimonadaceae bacterium]
MTTAAMRYRRNAAGALDSTYDRALAERLLRTALAFGITTVRDPGASPAHRHGLPVIGHLQRTSWTEAARLDFITHGADWNAGHLPPERRGAYGNVGGGVRARIAWLEWLDPDALALDTMVQVLAERGVSVDPTLVAYHTKFFWRDSIYQRDPDHAIVPEHVENWRVLGMHTADWSQEEFDRVQRVWHKQLALVSSSC